MKYTLILLSLYLQPSRVGDTPYRVFLTGAVAPKCNGGAKLAQADWNPAVEGRAESGFDVRLTSRAGLNSWF